MIKVRKDLTGMRFGRLVVLRQAEDVFIGDCRYSAWWVQCDCGSEPFVIPGSYLTNKKGTRSCGCIRQGTLDGKSNVRKNLVGKRFGRLVVLKQVEDYIFPSGRRAAQWFCQCDCGNTCTVRGWDLMSGDTTSCGCYRKECEIKNLTPYSYEKLYNEYDLESKEYGIGYTNKGEEFWFDKEDYELIKDYCWSYNGHGYVVSADPITRKTIRLHRLVMEVNDPNIVIDHKKHPPRNGHKKDNRKSNLRITDALRNSHNKSLNKNNTSGYTGVYYKKDMDKWYAQLGYCGKNYFRGYFETEEEAIVARKELENEHFGEYSYENSQKEAV